MTPTTVRFVASIVICLPTIAESARERGLPQLARQHDRRRGVGQRLLQLNVRPSRGCTPSAVNRLADTCAAASRDGFAIRLDVQRADGVRADSGERAIALAELEELRRRHPELVEAHARELARDEHELLGVRIAERSQDDAVDDAEDRGVGADAQREREHGDERESGNAAQAANRRSGGPGEGAT